MQDYSNIGYTKKLVNESSLANKPRSFTPAMKQDIAIEKSPWASPTFISKGVVTSNLGGILELRDATGGTVLLTANPDTGVVTINGGIVANQTLNFGTIYNSVLAGNSSNTGTFNLGVGTLGTINNTIMVTPDIVGGTTTNLVLNSPLFFGGTLSNPAINNSAITQSSADTIRLLGTPNLTISTGSSILTNAGDFKFQIFGTSLVLAVNVGGTAGTTFKFSPSGTLP